MLITDWYCALSVAIDREEDKAYAQSMAAYVAGGYDIKKLPKRQRPSRSTTSDGEGTVNVLDALKRSGMPMPQRKGTFEEYARIKRMRKVFQTADGGFVDENGHPVNMPEGSVYVPTKQYNEGDR